MTTIAIPNKTQSQILSIHVHGSVDLENRFGILMTRAEIERNEWLDK